MPSFAPELSESPPPFPPFVVSSSLTPCCVAPCVYTTAHSSVSLAKGRSVAPRSWTQTRAWDCDCELARTHLVRLRQLARADRVVAFPGGLAGVEFLCVRVEQVQSARERRGARVPQLHRGRARADAPGRCPASWL